MVHKYLETSDCSICVLDTAGHYVKHIRNQLVKYKARFSDSLADKICVINSVDEAPQGAILVIPSYIYESVPNKSTLRCEVISSISNLTHYDLRRMVIEPLVRYTRNPKEAAEWLSQLPDVFTYDCETAAIIAEGEIIDEKERKNRALNVRQHELTMFSFGISESEAFVISNEPCMDNLVMDFLTTTDKKVIMHNASFDMKIVKFLTGKFIKNFEDTQVLSWVKLNHSDTYKAKVGLKGLAGHIYKDWAVSADLFGIEHKYNPDLIKYSGIDAMATMFVYNEFNEKE